MRACQRKEAEMHLMPFATKVRTRGVCPWKHTFRLNISGRATYDEDCFIVVCDEISALAEEAVEKTYEGWRLQSH